jgi:hypothetical protein
LRYNATKQEEEEGDGSIATIAFFIVTSCTTQKRRRRRLQRNVAFFAMLRCSAMYVVELRYKATPQTNKQNKQEKKK